MPTLHVANFDFDDRLARPERGDLPASLRGINERLRPLLEPLLKSGDAAVVAGESVERGRFDRAVPWGVEPHVLHWLGTLGLAGGFPDPAVVRAVNGRRFQWECETTLGVRPAGARWCGTAEEFADAAASLSDANPSGWVAKAEFGGSGRGVRFGAGEPTDAVVRWVAAGCRRGGGFLVEPRLWTAAEAGVHFTVWPDGRVRHDGVTGLTSHPDGRFRRSEPLASGEQGDWGDAVTAGERVARLAADRGYHGPLSVDAARLTDGTLRPVQDVNARRTMGRVALETGRPVP